MFSCKCVFGKTGRGLQNMMLLEGNVVKATGVSTFRKLLKENLDRVVKNEEVLIVTRPEDENVVVLSEDRFNDVMREISNLKYLLKLKKAEEEIERGKTVTFDIDLQFSFYGGDFLQQDYKEVEFTVVAINEYREFKRAGSQAKVTKIRSLLKDIRLNGLEKGIGKPERLKYFNGEYETYSRRIDKEHRLVYQERRGVIYVLSCKGHYKK